MASHSTVMPVSGKETFDIINFLHGAQQLFVFQAEL